MLLVPWHSFAIPFSCVISKPIDILIICPCGLDIPTTERELEVLVSKAHDKGEPCWWEVVKEGCAKVAIVDGNQVGEGGVRVVWWEKLGERVSGSEIWWSFVLYY